MQSPTVKPTWWAPRPWPAQSGYNSCACRLLLVVMRKLLILPLVVLAANAPRAAQDLSVPSRDGLVVCVSAPACDAGASVMTRGGNAVDAAVATAFALAV